MWKYNPVTTKLDFTKPSQIITGNGSELSNLKVFEMTVLTSPTLVVHNYIEILEDGFIDLIGDMELI